VTVTYIRTKFGTELKYHTINTPEWSNSHKPKIQDGGRRHLRFLGYTTDYTTIQAGITACIQAQSIIQSIDQSHSLDGNSLQ